MLEVATTTSAGEVFARALARKDRRRLLATLADTVDFRALTPNRFWEATTGKQAVDEIMLGQWFETGDEIYALVSVRTASVSDREHVAYRLRIRNAEGDFIVEQQAYYTTKDGRIDWIRILCAGYRPSGDS